MQLPRTRAAHASLIGPSFFPALGLNPRTKTRIMRDDDRAVDGGSQPFLPEEVEHRKPRPITRERRVLYQGKRTRPRERDARASARSSRLSLVADGFFERERELEDRDRVLDRRDVVREVDLVERVERARRVGGILHRGHGGRDLGEALRDRGLGELADPREEARLVLVREIRPLGAEHEAHLELAALERARRGRPSRG